MSYRNLPPSIQKEAIPNQPSKEAEIDEWAKRLKGDRDLHYGGYRDLCFKLLAEFEVIKESHGRVIKKYMEKTDALESQLSILLEECEIKEHQINDLRAELIPLRAEKREYRDFLQSIRSAIKMGDLWFEAKRLLETYSESSNPTPPPNVFHCPDINNCQEFGCEGDCKHISNHTASAILQKHLTALYRGFNITLLGEHEARVRRFINGLAEDLAVFDRKLPGELETRHVTADIPAEQCDSNLRQIEAGVDEIRCSHCGAINEPDMADIFRKNCWECKKTLVHSAAPDGEVPEEIGKLINELTDEIMEEEDMFNFPAYGLVKMAIATYRKLMENLDAEPFQPSITKPEGECETNEIGYVQHGARMMQSFLSSKEKELEDLRDRLAAALKAANDLEGLAAKKSREASAYRAMLEIIRDAPPGHVVPCLRSGCNDALIKYSSSNSQNQ